MEFIRGAFHLPVCNLNILKGSCSLMNHLYAEPSNVSPQCSFTPCWEKKGPGYELLLMRQNLIPLWLTLPGGFFI